MDKGLEEALSNAVNGLTESLAGVKEFALDQAPDVIQQLIAWTMVSCITGMAACVVVTSVCVAILISMHKEFSKDEDDRGGIWIDPEDQGFSFTAVFAIAFSGFCIFISSITIFGKATTLMQLYIAPKVWLLEHVKSMIP